MPMSRLLTKAMRQAQRHVRHVAPVPAGQAGGLVADVYAQLERDFGMLAPPVSLHSPAPEVLAAAWLVLRETLLAQGQASRAAKEAVATAVSEANVCPYCVEVHSATQDRVGRAAASTRWIAGDGPVPEPAAEYVGVAVTFEYLNRMAHVFLPASPFPPQAPAAVRKQARKVLGRLAVPDRRASAEPGAALGLLPDARLPDDLSWAGGSPSIGPALARASAAFDAAGRRSVEPAVRDLVRQQLGGSPGLSRGWVEHAVAGLPAEQRPAGRLALLTALAAYQVDDGVVAAYRGDPAALIELTAWAAWTAARHQGTVLARRVTA
jgi:AhpD family alkylhydroperoxidase